jgi:hypothetical protein
MDNVGAAIFFAQAVIRIASVGDQDRFASQSIGKFQKGFRVHIGHDVVAASRNFFQRLLD